jgi:glycosyltransferase involved in cell wall biosynthesis
MQKISIAMATYNGSGFLREQLESLAQQTVLPFELVITDDGSTDDTESIILAFSKSMSFPVRFIKNNHNMGYRENFIQAAGLCAGDVIAFCDQDDIWLPDKLEKCIEEFDDPSVALVYHAARIVDEKLHAIGQLAIAPPRKYNPANTLSPTFYGYGFTLLIRRELTALNARWKGSVDFHTGNDPEAHDQWFFFLASSLGSIVYLEDELVLYRRHQTTTTQHTGARGWMHGLKIFVSNDLRPIDYKRRCAEHRAKVLIDVEDLMGHRYHDNAEFAYQGYRKLASACALRLEMYASHNPFFKLMTFIQLVMGGAYRPRSEWGAGKRTLIRDFVRGVCWKIRLVNSE